MAASRFKKLNDLSPEQLQEVDTLLLDKTPASSVVTKIKDEWGLFPEMKPDTLKKMLERYRASELKNKVVNAIAERVTGTHITGLSKKLNAVEELTALAIIQKGRFEKGLTTESKSPLLMGTVSAEAKLLKEMLVDLGKLQLETGIIQKAPKKLTGTMIDEDGNVSSFEWTEEQKKLYHELEAFGEDGEFAVV